MKREGNAVLLDVVRGDTEYEYATALLTVQHAQCFMAVRANTEHRCRIIHRFSQLPWSRWRLELIQGSELSVRVRRERVAPLYEVTKYIDVVYMFVKLRRQQ